MAISFTLLQMARFRFIDVILKEKEGKERSSLLPFSLLLIKKANIIIIIRISGSLPFFLQTPQTLPRAGFMHHFSPCQTSLVYRNISRIASIRRITSCTLTSPFWSISAASNCSGVRVFETLITESIIIMTSATDVCPSKLTSPRDSSLCLEAEGNAFFLV